MATAVGVAQVGGTYAAAMHHSSRSISPGGFVLLALGPAALVARRRFPVAVLAATYVTTLWYATSPNPGGPIWDALIVAFGTAIYYRKRAAAIGFLVAGYAGALWGPEVVSGQRGPTAMFALALALGLAALLAASEGIRLRRQRAAAIERSREDDARRRASEERLRIARDVHDVVAHSISVINVQANTALHLMDRQPDRARLALSNINEVSKQALAELRSVLGVLRDVAEDVPRAPSPTLAGLDGLLARAAGAGLAVRVDRAGEPVPLPAGVELAAYRIIQEALTNAARHSGGSTANVHIAFDGRQPEGHGPEKHGPDQHGPDQHRLVVQVDDDGAARAPLRASQAGNGIIGMRERVQALGGELQAGPRPGGGFRVRASLPFDEVAT